MKVYQTLRIKASSNMLVNLLDSWKNSQHPGWRYDEDKTLFYARNILTSASNVACFEIRVAALPSSTIWLVISEEVLKVTNIVPLEVSHLDYNEYNKIINAFYQTFVATLKNNNEYKILLSSAYPSIINLANKRTADKLVLWETLCNPDDGNLHPNDEQRWFDFIITAAQTHSPLDSEILKRWLVEDKKWIDNENGVVERLCSEYENGVRLIQYYEENYKD